MTLVLEIKYDCYWKAMWQVGKSQFWPLAHLVHLDSHVCFFRYYSILFIPNFRCLVLNLSENLLELSGGGPASL